jgi:hypothetical protein
MCPRCPRPLCVRAGGRSPHIAYTESLYESSSKKESIPGPCAVMQTVPWHGTSTNTSNKEELLALEMDPPSRTASWAGSLGREDELEELSPIAKDDSPSVSLQWEPPEPRAKVP